MTNKTLLDNTAEIIGHDGYCALNESGKPCDCGYLDQINKLVALTKQYARELIESEMEQEPTNIHHPFYLEELQENHKRESLLNELLAKIEES